MTRRIILLIVAMFAAPASGQAILADDEWTEVAFDVAVEDFVHASGTVRTLEQAMPARLAKMVRRLGCEHYACREDAEDDIARLGDNGVRAVVWGTYHADAEIKMRSNRLMRYLICPDCGGSGRCRTSVDEGWCDRCRWNASAVTRNIQCHACNGWRRLRRPPR